MKSYIISVAAASVISAISTMIAPEKWSKYISIVTGIIITLCISRPILEIMKTDIFENLEFEYNPSVVYDESQYRTEVFSELQKQLCNDIKQRLMNEFGQVCEVGVTLCQNAEGELAGIEIIEISGGNIDSAAIGRLREVYGAKYVKKSN